MEFMEKSDKPTLFPTNGELMRAGRIDLVEAIKRRGGWYSMGWDDENVEEAMDFDLEEFQRRVGIHGATASFVDNSDSLSLEIGAEEDDGIEGILSRLKKQRINEFGNIGKSRYETCDTSKDDEYDDNFDMSKDEARTSLGKSSRIMHQKGILNASSGKISPNFEPVTWRTWSDQRSGFQHTKFEAAEISFNTMQVESNEETYNDGITLTTEEYGEAQDRPEEMNHQIRRRLQHLEVELNTALCSLRSKREDCISEEATGSSGENLQKLSDAWEFQENEFISAQGRLRSIRAKLTVLEGKLALAIIDTQKIVEEKHKRIDVARKALQLLCTTFVVWPNSASVVLLAGSFDGWTTQRKMEKSRTGIFSACLKLYPGRYEIKFIVDGLWKVDPLHPIVNNNGYENNLLIIT